VLADLSPGKQVSVVLVRGNTKKTLKLTLGSYPGS